jgi:hypothetical protein
MGRYFKRYWEAGSRSYLKIKRDRNGRAGGSDWLSNYLKNEDGDRRRKHDYRSLSTEGSEWGFRLVKIIR